MPGGTGGAGSAPSAQLQVAYGALLRLGDFPTGFSALGFAGPSDQAGTERGLDATVAGCTGHGLDAAIGPSAVGEASATFVRASSLLATDTVTVVDARRARALWPVLSGHRFASCLASALDGLARAELFGGSASVKVSPATVRTLRPAWPQGGGVDVLATLQVHGGGPPATVFIESVFLARAGLLSSLSLQSRNRRFPRPLARTLEQRAAARMAAER